MPTELTDKVLRFFDGDADKTLLWLTTENPMLGNVTPIYMILSGKEKRVEKFIDEALSHNPEEISHIKTRKEFDLSKESYEEHIITIDGRDTLSFCVNNNNSHEDDRGYVLYSLKQTGEPVTIDTYFGMPRKVAREFANKILEITK